VTSHTPHYAAIRTQSRIVLLLLGAWEQHGPHLPLHTDTIIIEAVVQNALKSCPTIVQRFVVAPTLAITASDEHAGFDGSLSTGTTALVDSVVAICRSASWASGVCIINGHGGNADALSRVTSALRHENISHKVWSLPSYEGGDMHAGHTETSVLLHIAPHLVDMSRAERGATGNASDLIAAMRDGGIAAVSSNGIIGDATTATAEHGASVMSLYERSLVATLQLCADSWPVVSS
jgi:mycofactocin precursor peptide peptidase